MKNQLTILTSDLLPDYLEKVSNDLKGAFDALQDAEISTDTFSFYTSVSSVFSSKISVLRFDVESFFKLYDQHHDIERLFRLLFEKEYVNTVKRIENPEFKTAKERYAELLKTTDYVQKIPLKYIATYLGITQVSLSRIRADVK